MENTTGPLIWNRMGSHDCQFHHWLCCRFTKTCTRAWCRASWRRTSNSWAWLRWRHAVQIVAGSTTCSTGGFFLSENRGTPFFWMVEVIIFPFADCFKLQVYPILRAVRALWAATLVALLWSLASCPVKKAWGWCLWLIGVASTFLNIHVHVHMYIHNRYVYVM